MTVTRTRGNCQDAIVKATNQCHQLSATKLQQIYSRYIPNASWQQFLHES